MPRPVTPDDVPPPVGEIWLPSAPVDVISKVRGGKIVKQVAYSQYWRRIDFHAFDCGVTYERDVTTTVGSKTETVREIGGKLGVSIGQVAAELSAKLTVTVTIALEHETSRKITAPARKCYGTSLTTWQLVDRFDVARQRTIFGIKGRRTAARLEQPADAYWSDTFLWAAPKCCPDGMSDGPGVLVDYAGLRALLIPELTPTGETRLLNDVMTFADVKGAYRLGDLVPAVALEGELADVVPEEARSTSTPLRPFLAPLPAAASEHAPSLVSRESTAVQ